MSKIISYCDRIHQYLERFDNRYTSFADDYLFQDGCCMCVVQIGELVAQLSDEAKANDPSIPWRAIKDTRNFYVHAYGSIDLEMVWTTITEDIPVLKKACEKMIGFQEDS